MYEYLVHAGARAPATERVPAYWCPARMSSIRSLNVRCRVRSCVWAGCDGSYVCSLYVAMRMLRIANDVDTGHALSHQHYSGHVAV